MFVCRLAGVAAMVALMGLPASGQNTIFFDDFGGAAGVPLHGLAPTLDPTGGNTWLTRTDTGTPEGTGVVFFADGTIIGSTAPGSGATASGSATLGFTPTPGFVYTLSASFDAVTAAGGNWVALGFTEARTSAGGNGGRFISSPTAGQPWMIYRGSEATILDSVFYGPGTTPGPGIDWSTPVTPARGAPVDLRIVLDTSQSAWTAEWLAKNPGDASYTTVGFHTYDANPTIGGVGIAIANNTVLSSISSFRLETTGPVFIPGDVNGDGEVDILDFNIISDNLFNTGVTRSDGDLNGDGVVDFADFRIWKEVFEAGGGSAAGLLAVPEPAGGLLVGLGLLFIAAGRRHGRR